jgi:hypothetical protein
MSTCVYLWVFRTRRLRRSKRGARRQDEAMKKPMPVHTVGAKREYSAPQNPRFDSYETWGTGHRVCLCGSSQTPC